MNMNYLFIGLLMLLLVFISACTSRTTTNTVSENSGLIEASESGTVLAGTTSKYIDFNKADYERAKTENKVVLLDFYATWCLICIEEQKETVAAFDDLDNPNVIGFRVNYKDSDTDSDENALAEEFGIIYQHTKVIIKDGEVVQKALDSWDKDRFLSEINRFV
ncbi:MAG: hypothetical protein ISS25_03145 [Nanoarchaeota archaeon]|nr:hypothetical protein [DPANN group archaeon]MBL7116797.1 hypothetical protein [Nanoarchaeota archaeon]